MLPIFAEIRHLLVIHLWMYSIHIILSKAKQRYVMGVGMCLYAQLVQMKNKY